jgi:UDP-2,3-diacylglucosamine hydrolase
LIVMANPPGAGALAILAGGGALPIIVAREAAAAGRAVHMLAIEGSFGDLTRSPCPVTPVAMGKVGGILDALKRNGCTEMVIAGSVERPELRQLKFDLRALMILPTVAGMMLGGDNRLLTIVVRFFESKGYRIVGADDVAPSLLAGTGPLGLVRPSSEGLADMTRGFEIVKALGALDVGQAAVVSNGYTLAVEAAEGTDAMLERVAGLRRARNRLTGRRKGVLVKRAKPGQDRRVDLPTIGPRTIELAAAANLAGVGVQSRGVLVIERERVLALADEAGMWVTGFADDD